MDPNAVISTPVTPPATAPAVAPGSSGVPTPGTPAPAADDAQNVDQRIRDLEALSVQREADIRAIKSSSDRRLYEAQKGWERKETEFREQINQSLLTGMNDEERRDFELEILRQERDGLKVERETLMQRLESERQMQEYLGWLTGLGIDTSKFDRSDPSMVGQQATEALANTIQTLRREAQAAKVAPVSPPAPPALPTPARGPAVVTGQVGGQTPSVKPTFEDIRDALTRRLGHPASDGEVFDAARRGEFDLNQMFT